MTRDEQSPRHSDDETKDHEPGSVTADLGRDEKLLDPPYSVQTSG